MDVSFFCQKCAKELDSNGCVCSYTEKIEKLREALQRLEYCGPGDTCPVCGYFTRDMEDMKVAGIISRVGHADKCIVGAALLDNKDESNL